MAAPVAALWLGPGDLFEELSSVLVVLAQGSAHSPGSIESIGDLDRLLDPPPPSGRLLLEVEALPTEDIGLVRRFLRRYAEWSLILFGGDPRHSTVRSLSADGRSRWLPWPPDLDQMRALVGLDSSHGRAPLAGPAPSTPLTSTPLAALPTQLPGRPSAPVGLLGEPFDLGELVEETLASSALEDGPPRYEYTASGNLATRLPRIQVAAIVEAVLGIAGAVGGPGAHIEVEASPGPSGGLGLAVAFPAGPLGVDEPQRFLDPVFVATELGMEMGARFEEASIYLSDLGGSATAHAAHGQRLTLSVELPGV